jgi:hypothetical protein
MLVEDVQWPTGSDEGLDQIGEVVVTGVVRGKGLRQIDLCRLEIGVTSRSRK